MTICYFGSYDQSYGRTRVLTKGLRKNGDTVYECHSSRSIMAGRWVELFYNFLKIKCDLILVGFPGHTDVFLAWIIAKMFHKRLIFDAFISLYDSRCLDKKEYNPKSFSGRLLWLQDMITCHIVDFTLLDTHEHINFFVNEFNIVFRENETSVIDHNKVVSRALIFVKMNFHCCKCTKFRMVLSIKFK